MIDSENVFMQNLESAEKVLAEIREADLEHAIIALFKNKYEIDIHYIEFSFDYAGQLNVAVYLENTDEWFKFNRRFFNDLSGVMGNVVKHGELVDDVNNILYSSNILVGSALILSYDYSMEYKGKCMVRLIKELLKLRFYEYWYTYDINDDRFYIIIEVEDKTKLKAALENAENVKAAVHNILDKIDIQGRIEKNEIGYAVGCRADIIGRDAMHCVNEESLERCYKL